MDVASTELDKVEKTWNFKTNIEKTTVELETAEEKILMKNKRVFNKKNESNV